VTLFDTPTALAAHRAHLDALRPADLPDECQASQRTLAAVAALLFHLDGLEAENRTLRAKVEHFAGGGSD
jgi:hypothetical protein